MAHLGLAARARCPSRGTELVHGSYTETRKGSAETTANPLLSVGLFGGLDGT